MWAELTNQTMDDCSQTSLVIVSMNKLFMH